MNLNNKLATDEHGYTRMKTRQTMVGAHNGNDMGIIRVSSVFIRGWKILGVQL
jgi:hypothetical protein